jgi:hypothetical protein
LDLPVNLISERIFLGKEPALHAQHEHAFTVLYPYSTSLQSRKQSKHHRASIHKVFMGLDPLLRDCPLRDVSPVASLSPLKREIHLYSAVSSSSSSLGTICRVFTAPFHSQILSRPLTHLLHRLHLLLLLLWPKHQSIDSLRLFAQQWLPSPYALHPVDSRVHELRYEWARSLPAHGCTEPGLGVAQKHTLGASQADSRIRCMASTTSRCRT